jgi:hypothetical protein
MGDQGSRWPGRIRSVGTKKTAFMAVFVAATFGLMALLSVPSRFLPPSLRVPSPIKRALNPFDPLIPSIVGGAGHPKTQVSQGILGADLRRSPVAAALRPQHVPPPPVPGSKGPVPPPPVPSVDLRRATGGHGFDPENRERHMDRRASHRHRHRHPPRHRPRHPHEGRPHLVGNRCVFRTAGRPVHPHWPGGPGRRAGRPR